MSALLTAGLVTAGATLAGQGINAYSAGRMNKRAEKFAWKMYDKQRGDALSDWEMTNAYNDPSAQMERLQNAGLNPNLVYGNGATTESAPVRGSSASSPNFKPVQMDLGSVVQQAMATKQLQANIARTEAETDAINSRTVSQRFQNALNDAIGIDKMWERYSNESDIIANKFNKENLEFEAWKAGAISENGLSKNSPVVRAIRAGYETAEQQLKQAKVQEDISRATAIIKNFEANLAKQGVSPNSPWYVKFLGDLLMSTGLLNKLNPF